MTTIEAMFCGRPVVATNVGINSEVIKEGLSGFLASSATVEALDNALEQMWERRGELEKIGGHAFEVVRQFMPDDPIEAFAKKLKDLVAHGA